MHYWRVSRPDLLSHHLLHFRLVVETGVDLLYKRIIFVGCSPGISRYQVIERTFLNVTDRRVIKGANVVPMINKIGFFVNGWRKIFPIRKNIIIGLSFNSCVGDEAESKNYYPSFCFRGMYTVRSGALILLAYNSYFVCGGLEDEAMGLWIIQQHPDRV